jgi:hypothetical protein
MSPKNLIIRDADHARELLIIMEARVQEANLLAFSRYKELNGMRAMLFMSGTVPVSRLGHRRLKFQLYAIDKSLTRGLSDRQRNNNKGRRYAQKNLTGSMIKELSRWQDA